MVILILTLLAAINHTWSNPESPTLEKNYLETAARTQEKSLQLAELIKQHENNSEKKKDEQLFLLKHQQQQLHKELNYIKQETLRKEHQRSINGFYFDTQLEPIYWYGSNLELLNNNNTSDRYSFFNYTVDSRLASFNPHKTNFNPVNFMLGLRIKGIMGNVGNYTQTNEASIKIGKALTESHHNHSINRLLIWARQLWFKYQPNEFNKNQFLQVGFFPFQLGNGITLGNAHIMGTTIPGQHTFFSIDQFRPGILISSSGLKDQLTVQAYCGFITTNSESFNTTTSFTNAQSLEQGNKAERGPYKKDVVAAFQAQIKPYHYQNNNQLTINPYLLFNNNNDGTVEFSSDSKLQMYTPGIALQCKKNKLSCSFELAKNYGHQTIKAIDRNIFFNTSATFQNHLFYVPAGTTGVVFTDPDFTSNGVTDPDDFEFSTITLNPANTSGNYANGQKFAVLNSDNTTYTFLKNSYSRFRNRYTNNLQGWMAYADIQYQTDHITASAVCACASGDNNPNDSEEKIMMTRLTENTIYKDYSKSYDGFVGIEQLLTNKTVTSYFILESHKLQRALFASHKLTPPTFTNMIVCGSSLGFQSKNSDRCIKAQLNALTFFQYKKTEKEYNYSLTDALIVNHTETIRNDATQMTNLHLGTEFNLKVDCKLTDSIELNALLALFIPGDYYKSTQLKYIPIATQIKLAGTDFTGIEDERSKYASQLGNNSALLASIGISAAFDINGKRQKNKILLKRN